MGHHWLYWPIILLGALASALVMLRTGDVMLMMGVGIPAGIAAAAIDLREG